LGHIPCGMGARYLGYQEGIITVVGLGEDHWYIQDFFYFPNSDSKYNITFAANRKIKFYDINITNVVWDSTFLYVMSGVNTFMIQLGIPVNSTANNDDFQYFYSGFGSIINILPIEHFGLDHLLILTNETLTLYSLLVDNPFLVCRPKDNTPDAKYSMEVAALLKDCPMKQQFNDNSPMSICEIRQNYEITLITTEQSLAAHTVNYKNLIMALAAGIGLALIFSCVPCAAIRLYKKK